MSEQRPYIGSLEQILSFAHWKDFLLALFWFGRFESNKLTISYGLGLDFNEFEARLEALARMERDEC